MELTAYKEPLEIPIGMGNSDAIYILETHQTAALDHGYGGRGEESGHRIWTMDGGCNQ